MSHWSDRNLASSSNFFIVGVLFWAKWDAVCLSFPASPSSSISPSSSTSSSSSTSPSSSTLLLLYPPSPSMLLPDDYSRDIEVTHYWFSFNRVMRSLRKQDSFHCIPFIFSHILFFIWFSICFGWILLYLFRCIYKFADYVMEIIVFFPFFSIRRVTVIMYFSFLSLFITREGKTLQHRTEPTDTDITLYNITRIIELRIMQKVRLQ